jgi:hypothetical protein
VELVPVPYMPGYFIDSRALERSIIDSMRVPASLLDPAEGTFTRDVALRTFEGRLFGPSPLARLTPTTLAMIDLLEGPQTEPGPRVDEQGKPIGED